MTEKQNPQRIFPHSLIIVSLLACFGLLVSVILTPQTQPTKTLGEIPALCNARNQGPFNGKVLYDCVFGEIVKTDLSIMDRSKRADFIAKWQHKYDQSEMLGTEENTYRAIKKMVRDLGEMHTAFLTPKEARDLYLSTQGNVFGIGAPLTRLGLRSAEKALGENPSAEARRSLNKISADTPLVVYPAPDRDSPAYQAGLRAGDRIAALNGTSTIGQTMAAVVDSIKGDAGTTVVLSVHRPSGSGYEDKDISITRGAVHVPQVVTQALPGDFLKVTITSFTQTVAQEFTDALYLACTGKQLPYDVRALLPILQSDKPERDCAIKGLVLDLRNNGGGVMEQATAIAQLIMENGPTITIQQREGDRSIETRERIEHDGYVKEVVENGKVIQSKKTTRFFRIVPTVPIVVLVNGMSASASEILGGMLQADGLATVVGTSSYGKEVGQSFKPIDFGSAVKITTFRFLPGGVALGAGVIPDFEVLPGDDFIDDPFHAQDTQLARAVEVLSRGEAAVKEAHSASALADRAARSTQAVEKHRLREREFFAASSQ
ncbi:MAG: hypothetical protein JST01_16995 [Cyanobacteria bacterium SZAS TMP-1]|nr:hypothetical protein [Cyanobacteria bacterium SZAS TMP-1]